MGRSEEVRDERAPERTEEKECSWEQMKQSCRGTHRHRFLCHALPLQRKKVKCGDRLTVWTLKGGSKEACNNRTEVHRKAKVIAVYPHFVRTRLANPYPGRTGCEESFRWDDIVKWNKYLWEGAQNESVSCM